MNSWSFSRRHSVQLKEGVERRESAAVMAYFRFIADM